MGWIGIAPSTQNTKYDRFTYKNSLLLCQGAPTDKCQSENYQTDFFEISWVYVTFDGDYEYLQKVWKIFIFDHFNDFFYFVFSLKKSRNIEKKKFLPGFVANPLSIIYEKKYFEKKQSCDFWLIFRHLGRFFIIRKPIFLKNINFE